MKNSNVVSDEEIKVLAEKAIPDCRTLGDDLGLTYPQSALPKIKRGAWHAGFKSALKYKSKTIIEPIKDEELEDLFPQPIEWIGDFKDDWYRDNNILPKKELNELWSEHRRFISMIYKYQKKLFNENVKEYAASKLNNSVEDKPELTELLCNGRKVEVNDKDYVVTSATRATNNSIIFHLSGEKDSLQLKLKQ